MNPNTLIITRTLDRREMDELRRRLREMWPGQEWTILHGSMLRELDELQSVGPSEFKDVTTAAGRREFATATMTPVPRWEV